MSRKAWIGIGAAVTLLVVAGGGYALLLQSANDAVERSLAQFRGELPPGASFSHGPYEVDLLERSVVLEAPVIDMAGASGFGEISAARAVVEGLEPGGEATRAARIRLEAVRVVDAESTERTLTAERVSLFEVALPGAASSARQALAEAMADAAVFEGLAFAAGPTALDIAEVRIEDIDRGRLGALLVSGLDVAIQDPRDGGRMALERYSLSGLDVSDLLALSERDIAAMDERDVADLATRIVAGLDGFEGVGLSLDLAAVEAPILLTRFALEDVQRSEGRLVGGTTLVEGLSLPLGPLVAGQIRRIVPGLPLEDRMVLSAAVEQRYRPETEELDLAHVLTVHESLEMRLDVLLAGMQEPLHLGMGEAQLQAALLGANLTRAQAVLIDLGFVAPALEAMAQRSGMSEGAYREMLTVQAAAALRRLGLQATADEVGGAVERFLAAPGRLTVALDPQRPVPLLMLGVVGSTREAVELLAPTVSAEPPNES